MTQVSYTTILLSPVRNGVSQRGFDHTRLKMTKYTGKNVTQSRKF